MSEYTVMARNFAEKHGIELSFIDDPEYKKYFDSDKERRYVFKCRLARHGKSYAFSFGQSIAEGSNKPDIYSVLACLTKYDPGDIWNFIAEYGYEPSKQTEKIYNAVCEEYKAVSRLFGDIMPELSEIN